MSAAPAQKPIGGRWIPSLPEIALAACLLGLAVLTAVVADADTVPGEKEPSTWWHWALVVAPSIPVAFRRVAPLVATPITVVAQMAVWGVGLATAFFAPLVMIYTVRAETGERGRTVAAASAAALTAMALIGVFVAPDVTVDLLLFTALASVMAYLLGAHAAQSKAEAVQLAEDLVVARVERDVAHERVAAAERQRIARELHDTVGHSLSVIAVRAEAADRVADKNPDAAIDAVQAIATTARESLADVRRVLSGLRDEHEDVELAPLPSLASIPALIGDIRASGREFALEGSLPPDERVGATVAAGAYRIVQEALTNVLKHGGDYATAKVRIEVDGTVLRVSVSDTGRGGSAPAPSEGTPGLGLAGMQERAEVLGGHFESGPRSGGGYRVLAELPIDAPAPGERPPADAVEADATPIGEAR